MLDETIFYVGLLKLTVNRKLQGRYVCLPDCLLRSTDTLGTFRQRTFGNEGEKKTEKRNEQKLWKLTSI